MNGLGILTLHKILDVAHLLPQTGYDISDHVFHKSRVRKHLFCYRLLINPSQQIVYIANGSLLSYRD